MKTIQEVLDRVMPIINEEPQELRLARYFYKELRWTKNEAEHFLACHTPLNNSAIELVAEYYDELEQGVII